MKTVRHIVFCMVMTSLLLAGFGYVSPAEAAGPPPAVIMETSMGRIIIILNPKDAPKTVANFMKYVDDGFYDNTIFHRVIAMDEKNYKLGVSKAAINIVQGGGFTYPMRMKRPTYPPIINEDMRAPNNTKGTIAMARTNDPNSATSQFFFNVENNLPLDPRVRKQSTITGASIGDNEKTLGSTTDGIEISTNHGYCVFGKVIRGMDVVEKIHKVKTGRKGNYEDVPVKPVYLIKAYRAK